MAVRVVYDNDLEPSLKALVRASKAAEDSLGAFHIIKVAYTSATL